MVACTKEGDSGKVPRESGLKNDLESRNLKIDWKKEMHISGPRPFVFVGSSKRLGVVKGNPNHHPHPEGYIIPTTYQRNQNNPLMKCEKL